MHSSRSAKTASFLLGNEEKWGSLWTHKTPRGSRWQNWTFPIFWLNFTEGQPPNKRNDSLWRWKVPLLLINFFKSPQSFCILGLLNPRQSNFKVSRPHCCLGSVGQTEVLLLLPAYSSMKTSKTLPASINHRTSRWRMAGKDIVFASKGMWPCNPH